jgi:hypothetical protein
MYEFGIQERSQGLPPIHFKEEIISLCHPEHSEGSLAGQRSFAVLRACPERSEGMTILPRLRLTRKTSSLKWIGACPCPVAP